MPSIATTKLYEAVYILDPDPGGPLDPAPYLRYLKEKFGELYGLE